MTCCRQVRNTKKPGGIYLCAGEQEHAKSVCESYRLHRKLQGLCKDFLTSGQNFIARQSITSMENMLSVHSFLRVHRSFIISIEKITAYNNNDVIIGEIEIPIGNLYKQQVMQVIHGR